MPKPETRMGRTQQSREHHYRFGHRLPASPSASLPSANYEKP